MWMCYYCTIINDKTPYSKGGKQMKPMNSKRRAEVVRAMDTLARCINDETILDNWLALGVADGDIKPDTTDEDIACYYEVDETFEDLMTTFLRNMCRAANNGGLYCDGIVSGSKHVEWR
jgi:hypothetical protein